MLYVIIWQKGKIITIKKESPTKQIVELLIDNNDKRLAINYPLISGLSRVGDEVVVNITAVELGLGTGGYDFVIANISNPPFGRLLSNEHIIKNRYTPLQYSVKNDEILEGSNPNDSFQERTLNKTPVLIISVHSMLPFLVTLLKYNNSKCKIIYVMTDSASLPIWISEHVELLLEQRLLDGTITSGQSFGGHYEAINKFSGLLMAKEKYAADIIIIGPGPGSVGTGTDYGFSSLEVGELVNAVHLLSGIPVVAPRISFHDKRKRHNGISHHTLLSLAKATLSKAYLPLPVLENHYNRVLQKQVVDHCLDIKHTVEWIYPSNKQNTKEKMDIFPSTITTMGRDFESDPAFFQALDVAAQFAINNFL